MQSQLLNFCRISFLPFRVELDSVFLENTYYLWLVVVLLILFQFIFDGFLRPKFYVKKLII